MKLYIKRVDGVKIPTQANGPEDAGYDIVATSGPFIHGDFIERPMDGVKLYRRVAFIEYGTDLYVAPEEHTTITWGPIEGSTSVIDWTAIGVLYHTQLWPRGSISKTNLVLANSIGLVDTGYRNQIMLRFKYIFQPEDLCIVQEDVPRIYGMVRDEHLYHVGDKAIQIVASPNVPINFEWTDTLSSSRRGLGAFGSSGK